MLVCLSFALIKVKNLLVPCPIKWLTGLDCPGCGFQRSIWAFVQGEYQESFKLYPPMLLFLISFLAALLTYIFKWNSESKVLKVLYISTGIVVLINYGYKVVTHQLD